MKTNECHKLKNNTCAVTGELCDGRFGLTCPIWIGERDEDNIKK